MTTTTTTATKPLLRVRDLHAGYGRAEVLHGIDLQAAVEDKLQKNAVKHPVPGGLISDV